MRNIYEDGTDFSPEGEAASGNAAREEERRPYRTAEEKRERRNERNAARRAADGGRISQPEQNQPQPQGRPPVYSAYNGNPVTMAAPYDVQQSYGQPPRINEPVQPQPGYAPYQPVYPQYPQNQGYPGYPQGYPQYAQPQYPQGQPPYGTGYPQPGYNPNPPYIPPVYQQPGGTPYRQPASQQGGDNGVPYTGGMRIVYQSPDYYNNQRGDARTDIPVITPSAGTAGSQDRQESSSGYTVSGTADSSGVVRINPDDGVKVSSSPYTVGRRNGEGTRAESDMRRSGFAVSDVDRVVVDSEVTVAGDKPEEKRGRKKRTGKKQEKSPARQTEPEKTPEEPEIESDPLIDIFDDDDDDDFDSSESSKRKGRGQKNDEDGGREKQPMTSSEKARITVLVISLVVALGSLFYLGYEFKMRLDNKKLEQEFSMSAQQELTETTAKKKTKKKDKTTEPVTETTESDEEYYKRLLAENPSAYPVGIQLKYVPYYAQNPDFVGYITIEGLGISLPVVQGEDDDEYLKKNFYGQSTKYGCPFVKYDNNMELIDKNTIIYGHYMHDGSVFAALHDYKSIDGYRRAPVITFNTLYKDYKWKIIGVFITNAFAKDDNDYYFRYYFTNLGSEQNFEDYLKAVEVRSLYSTGVDVLPTDKLLTLSTCTYEFSDARLVVVARMVRPGESSDVDTSLAQVNGNPRYPQAYYSKKNKKNPFDDTYNWIPQ